MGLTKDQAVGIFGALGVGLLVLLAVLAVRAGGPDKAPASTPLELRIKQCDQLPTIEKRLPCWQDAYRKDRQR